MPMVLWITGIKYEYEMPPEYAHFFISHQFLSSYRNSEVTLVDGA